MIRYDRGNPVGTLKRAWKPGSRYGVTLPRVEEEGEVTTKFFEIYGQETLVCFSIVSREDTHTRRAEIFFSHDERQFFATELVEGKDLLGIAGRTLDRLRRLKGGIAERREIEKVKYRGGLEIPRAAHGRT